MFDSHCHLDFSSLEDDWDAHLERARRGGVKAWFIPGCHQEQWKDLAAFQERKDPMEGEFFVGVGQHPYWSDEVKDLDVFCENLASNLRKLGAVAVGECGLDMGRGAALPHQAKLLEAHLTVAKELELPIVLHQVGAQELFLKTLKRVGLPRAGGVVHGFSGSRQWGEALVKRGLLLGIGPAITRVSRGRLREAAAVLPLDHLILETDAPDQRIAKGEDMDMGVPSDLSAVCSELAELRVACQKEIGEFCEMTTRRFFHLTPETKG